MTLQKPDGTTLTVTNMNVANYTVNPVLTYKTFDQGGGKIVGTLSLTASHPTRMRIPSSVPRLTTSPRRALQTLWLTCVIMAADMYPRLNTSII